MTKLEKKLLSIYRKLNEQSQSSLFDFADFLAEKSGNELIVSAEFPLVPTPESPSENESVIAAIKRLQRTYKMIDTNSLFTETSRLMSAHMVQGRSAEEVVVDLEALFEKSYQVYLTGSELG